jgi:hypothetical protein
MPNEDVLLRAAGIICALDPSPENYARVSKFSEAFLQTQEDVPESVHILLPTAVTVFCGLYYGLFSEGKKG